MKGHIRERGPRTFALVVDIGRDPATGKRRQRWRTIHGSRRDAQKALNAFLAEVQGGSFSEPSKQTTAEFLAVWLEKIKTTRRAQTYLNYEKIVRTALIPSFGAVPLVQLSGQHIQACLTASLAAGKAPNTVAQQHRVIHAALSLAVRWELVPRNAADGADPPRIPRKERPTLSAEESVRLIEAARGSRLYVPVLLAITTGMRRGEIFGLRWVDVDLLGGYVTVRQQLAMGAKGEYEFHETKTGESRRIRLPAVAVERLTEWRAEQAEQARRAGELWQEHGLVAPAGDGTPQRPNSVSGMFRTLVDRLGLPRVRFHDLRHSHGTLLLLARVPVKVVSERLGHSNTGITQDLYQHVLPAMQDEAAAAVDAALRRAEEAA